MFLEDRRLKVNEIYGCKHISIMNTAHFAGRTQYEEALSRMGSAFVER